MDEFWGVDKLVATNGDNPHGILAFLRKNLERSVVKNLSAFIAVGSTISRELGYSNRVHMMCPTVLQADAAHDLKIKEHFIKLYDDYYVCNGKCSGEFMVRLSGKEVCAHHSLCRHTLAECNCKRDIYHNSTESLLIDHYSTLLCTHSFYYLDLDKDLGRLSQNHRIFVIAH